MPVYIFQHPTTEDVKEVVQKMNEPHVFVGEDGTEWGRVFQSPNMAVDDGDGMGADTSCEEFIRKTKDKNYNLGEMWELSAGLSKKRAKIGGKDRVKEKAEKTYSKKCKGKEHPNAGQ
jgi:alkanesulfonate monooxygenase SsuD/methylene tetrahydromethanopterin reductase-like flavin-dependent oxidoreductase (luciferase family)